ncbi:MAG: carboxypeptidase regulatory-like domain-containing protein [Planctomycetes bacterium]|nr:carboxypeptidase regulatory-like domain-containing protein [Planctomycetota bacterium]
MIRSLQLARASVLLLASILFAGCSGSDGAPGTSTGTVTGTVTNAANSGAAVASATITLSPAVPGVTVTVNANGTFTANLPVGNYSLSCAAPNFQPLAKTLSVLAGISQTLDFALTPTSMVVVNVTGAPSSANPGESFSLTAAATALDGSAVQSYSWAQTGHAAAAAISGGTTQTATITLADAAAYKQALLDNLAPQDRWAVLGIEPLALEEAAATSFEVTVTTSSGTYKGDVDVHVAATFASATSGLRNVPVGIPVLFGGKDQASYDWSLSVPTGSTATLTDGMTRFPYFVPDRGGAFTVSVTDTTVTPNETVDIEVFAAPWVGGITGMDANGRPETSCAATCHATLYNEQFVDWANSGHAEIFTSQVNEGGHYGPNCFTCHTVGYDPDVSNGGIDDSTGYADFLSAIFPNGQSHPDPDNWETVLTNHPNQAMLANIQCENCHGPNGSGGAHANPMASGARASTSASVCATCHGEPPRHGRYQQWQESGHGNFQLAIDEGTSGSCAKCHTAQGFLNWAAQDFDTGYNPPAVDINEIQPITCVVCHDPHNVGTISGNSTNAPMRVQGDSPALLGGFTAYGIGKGAQCIVCHNTRRGEANEVITTTPDRAPHGGAQGDVMMGYNAFFVSVGVRGSHALIEDSCVTCHISLSPPPAEFSYNLSGTNHSFAANTSICGDCHGSFTASALQGVVEARLHALQEEIQATILAEMTFHTTNSRSLRITGSVGGTSTTVDLTDTANVSAIELIESHGRTAINITISGVHYEEVQLSAGIRIVAAGVENGRFLANTFSSVEDILARVCWNYNLVHADSSKGVHNPGWVTEIMAATEQQLATNWP